MWEEIVLFMAFLFGAGLTINLLRKHIGEKIENKRRITKLKISLSIGWCIASVACAIQEPSFWMRILWLFFGLFNSIQLGSEFKDLEELKDQEEF